MQNYFFTAPSRFFPSLTHLISPLFLQLQQHLRPFLESCDYVDSEYTQNWFLTFGGVKKRFQKRNFRQFLTIFEHLRRIFTDQEKAERVVQSIFSFSLTPPNVPVLIPKQFLDFEKIQKNIQKRPLLHPKLEKSKKCLFKGRRSGEIDFFFFSDPPSVPVLIPKFLKKNPKMSKKTPFTPKMSF